MDYNNTQLKHIQKRLIQSKIDLNKSKGFEAIYSASEFLTWFSHATLAGWSVEGTTGRMYQQKDNVRTYFKE